MHKCPCAFVNATPRVADQSRISGLAQCRLLQAPHGDNWRCGKTAIKLKQLAATQDPGIASQRRAAEAPPLVSHLLNMDMVTTRNANPTPYI
jgi:hypothetical protein